MLEPQFLPQFAHVASHEWWRNCDKNYDPIITHKTSLSDSLLHSIPPSTLYHVFDFFFFSF